MGYASDSREVGSGDGTAHNQSPSSVSSTCEPSPQSMAKASLPLPNAVVVTVTPAPQTWQTPAFPVPSAAIPVTAATRAAARHQRPWTHKQPQGSTSGRGHKQDAGGEPLPCTEDKGYDERQEEEKLLLLAGNASLRP
ncbi:hypothetical protein CB1_000851002 [Camelus ferus]|nr:hypothetical protein CB1_000851002 [Camelus ferus]